LPLGYLQGGAAVETSRCEIGAVCGNGLQEQQGGWLPCFSRGAMPPSRQVASTARVGARPHPGREPSWLMQERVLRSCSTGAVREDDAGRLELLRQAFCPGEPPNTARAAPSISRHRHLLRQQASKGICVQGGRAKSCRGGGPALHQLSAGRTSRKVAREQAGGGQPARKPRILLRNSDRF